MTKQKNWQVWGHNPGKENWKVQRIGRLNMAYPVSYKEAKRQAKKQYPNCTVTSVR
jgi:hypothetical protein